ncbi:MAG: methylmalonyl Co-A mutase-associated GTPase MeaB [Bacteroidota bacterium]|nr:methylmalonyl Co-A mutase-associated GTPase MeaB [Bacteroidota bacterium]
MSVRKEFVESLLAGERLIIARAISMVENEHPDALSLLRLLYSSTGNGYRIGITGPPGAGKSTITNKLAKLYRTENKRVGIIAVDPTSPFTGGALLGDRVRMTDVELDEGVFIRSMASRGSLGGLSKKAKEAADILDASGCDIILMETVGVGQSELDIARATDTTIVVLVPESGDSIQAMKAGLMEIADFFVVNKSDRAGADQAVLSINMVLNFKPKRDGWRPTVLQSVANDGKGIDVIAQKINEHRIYLNDQNILDKKRDERVIEQIRELVGEKLRIEFWNEERKRLLQSKLYEINTHNLTPYDVADELLENYKE